MQVQLNAINTYNNGCCSSLTNICVYLGIHITDVSRT